MYSRFWKRLIDIIGSFLAILLLSPVLALLVIGARMSTPGPAIFKQLRTGLHGDLFTLYKFRSMPVNTGNIASDSVGQIEISRFGRFIRRFNLDELPQLFNILKGDMSFVGPRPSLPSQTELIQIRKYTNVLSVRPGLTGLAQIRSFDGMSVAQKAKLDGRYVSRITFLGDLAIMLGTLRYLLLPPPVY